MKPDFIVLAAAMSFALAVSCPGKSHAFPDEYPLHFLDNLEGTAFPLTASQFLNLPDSDKSDYWRGALQATAYLRDKAGVQTHLSECAVHDDPDILALRTGFALYLRLPRFHAARHELADLPRTRVTNFLPHYFRIACSIDRSPEPSPPGIAPEVQQ